MSGLPEGWREHRIGEVAPKADAPMPGADEEVWNLSLEDVESHTGRVLDEKRMLVSELGSAKCSFDDSHVLYSKLRPYLNKVVVPEKAGVGTSELIPMRPDPELLDREFLAWYLRSAEFLDFAAANTRGANLPRIAMRALWRHPIPVPPLDEQRRIVGRIREMMERVDRVVGLRTERQSEVDALVPATLDDVFCAVGGTETPLFDLLLKSPQNGLYLPKSEYDSAGVPMVHMGDMFRRFELTGSPEKRVLADDDLVAKYGLSATDVLVARRSLVFEGSGSMTLVGQVDEPTLFESSIIRLQPNTAIIHPAYLVAFFYSREGTRRRLRITRKATISGVNQKGLATLTVPVPSLASQQTALERINDIRLAHAKLAEFDPAPEVDRLPAAILRKAFAGEL